MEVLSQSLNQLGESVQNFIQQYRCELSGVGVAALVVYLILAPKVPKQLRFCISHPLLKFLFIFVVVHLLGYDPTTTLLLSLIILVIVETISRRIEYIDDNKVEEKIIDSEYKSKIAVDVAKNVIKEVLENDVKAININEVNNLNIEEEQTEEVNVENTNLITCAGRDFDSEEIAGYSDDVLFAEISQ